MTGKTIAHYEIVEKIGEGGMGVVYRARDSKLGRDVALKVLPEQFARDPQRMGRFEREARVLASLNHPNIASIYGLEQSNGVRALVMELVEGPTLADRIDGGAIPLDEALPLARQIADALEYAHEHGVIHRDLKPANVKVTEDGTVKVLDFGLAKAMTDESAVSDPENSPTLTIGATKAGVILGTAAYMAPEQARGKRVDKRADIWSFGVVLYEMVTGQRLFRGEDMTETLAAVVMKEPDLSDAPAKVRRLLTRCLEKNPKTRLRDIGDAWELIEELPPNGRGSEDGHGSARPQFGRLPWAVACMALVAALVLGIGLWRSSQPQDQPLIHFYLDLPGHTDPPGSLNVTISDDGSRIAYTTAGSDGVTRLATRLLSEPDAHVLSGTENGYFPIFSPDGQWIAFGTGNQLKKVSVQGGSPLDLTSATAYLGGTWGRDGFLIATLNAFSNLVKVPESGGEPEPLKGTSDARAPQILPGGDAVLFLEGTTRSSQIRLLTLATGEVTTLLPNASFGRFLPTGGPSRGHLVYLSNGTLFAVLFDAAAGRTSGQPVPMLDDVGAFTVSESGTLLYQAGAVSSDWPIAWLRQDGTTQPLIEKRADYRNPELSPDGRLLAFSVDGPQEMARRVVIYDWNNSTSVPLTEPGEGANEPVWSPDSKHVAYFANGGGKNRIVWKRADGGGEEYTLLEGSQLTTATSISPDGKYLAFMQSGAETGADLWVAPLDLSNPDQPVVGEPEPVVRSPGLDYGLVFSPDGKWVAYGSDQSGAWSVYVQPFPGPGEPREIGPGSFPKWSRNGRQLFLLNPGSGNRIHTIDYQADGDAFIAGQPRVWSETPVRGTSVGPPYDLHPDGQRIVMFPTGEDSPDQATAPRYGVLLNFFDELRRRAPLD